MCRVRYSKDVSRKITPPFGFRSVVEYVVYKRAIVSSEKYEDSRIYREG